MPIHDWTRVSAGTWHAFHLSWTSEIQEALNAGLLPDGVYAQAEQIVGALGPDVLALQEPDEPQSAHLNGHAGASEPAAGGVAVAVAPPRTRLRAEAEMNDYVLKRRTVVVRHNSGDRIVALIELVSPGNKGSHRALESFVEKAQETLFRGFHLLVVDLFPPTVRDPNGMHGAIWAGLSEEPFELPADEPLTLAAYSAGPRKTAYIEPTAVGRALIDMPLFLRPEWYVNVPLQATYDAALRGVPKKYKQVLEAPPGA
jgi:hypothetical protein